MGRLQMQAGDEGNRTGQHYMSAFVTLSASSPMTETMAEGVASAAACMLSPRSFTSFSPSSKLRAVRHANPSALRCAQQRSCRHHTAEPLCAGDPPMVIHRADCLCEPGHLNAPAKARAVYSPRLRPQATSAASTAACAAQQRVVCIGGLLKFI